MKMLKDRVAVVTGASSGHRPRDRHRARARGLRPRDLGRERCGSGANRRRDPRARPTRVQRTTSTCPTRSACAATRTRSLAEYGQVNILVNNAGVTVTAEFADHSIEDFEWMIGINFWGVVYGCKFFLPHLKQAGEGHIVNLSSVFGLAGFPAQSSYCATKFAVRGFSESLWVELREHNIGVTSIHPGGVRTEHRQVRARVRAARAPADGIEASSSARR